MSPNSRQLMIVDRSFMTGVIRSFLLSVFRFLTRYIFGFLTRGRGTLGEAFLRYRLAAAMFHHECGGIGANRMASAEADTV